MTNETINELGKIANNRVVFNIKGNDYRLIIHIRYDKIITPITQGRPKSSLSIPRLSFCINLLWSYLITCNMIIAYA